MENGPKKPSRKPSIIPTIILINYLNEDISEMQQLFTRSLSTINYYQILINAN